MFVPLKRMPLNPNGKIDKPALPFPDTAQAANTEPARGGPAASPTEEAIRTIWARILPNAPSPLPLDESFFDLGGHSILATRLIFEIRKAFLVDAPLGLVFDKPTISALADAVERMRNADLGLTGGAPGSPSSPVGESADAAAAAAARRSFSLAPVTTSRVGSAPLRVVPLAVPLLMALRPRLLLKLSYPAAL